MDTQIGDPPIVPVELDLLPAPLWRVALVSIVALGIPIFVAYLIVLANEGRGWHTEGFGPFLAFTLAWIAVGAVIVRLGRVKSVVFGLMFIVSSMVYSSSQETPGAGPWIALGVGFLAGWLGTRHGQRFRPSPAGYALMWLMIAAVATTLVIWSQGSPAAAAAERWGRRTIVASFTDEIGFNEIGPEAYMLVTLPPWANDRYVIEHAVKLGWRWRLSGFNGPFAGSEEVMPGPFSGEQSPNLPGGCASPRVTSIPYEEMIRSCWFLKASLLAGVAPDGARTRTFEWLDAPSWTDRVTPFNKGFILTTYGRGDSDARPETLMRVVYRNAEGAIIDAVPAANLSLGWYRVVAGVAGAPACQIEFGRGFTCPPKKGVPREIYAYRALVSLALLRPDEYKSICGREPPRGDWVLLGRVLPGDSWDPNQRLTRTFTMKGVRFVELGVFAQLPDPEGLQQGLPRLDEASARTATSACFPKTG